MSDRPLALPLSALDEDRLRATAAAWSRWLGSEGLASPLAGLCRTAALGRASRTVRACPIGTSHQELARACERITQAAGPLARASPRIARLGDVADPLAMLALAYEQLPFAEAALEATAERPAVHSWLAEAGEAPPVEAAVEPARRGLAALLAALTGEGEGEPLILDVPAPAGRPPAATLVSVVADAWCAGVRVRWEHLLPPGIPRAPGPPSPWRRRRFPLPPEPAPRDEADVPAPDFSSRPPEVGAAAWMLDALTRVTGGRPPADATFATIGLDSLMALEVQQLARTERGVELALQALAPESSPSAAAAALDGAWADGSPGVPAVQPDPQAAHEPFPLTDIQRAYWLGRQEEYPLGGVACHWYAAWEVAAEFDVAAFEAAMDALIQRHPMLRAVVRADGTQRVLAEVAPFAVRRDLRDPERIAAELSHRVADPGSWPLFEAAVSEPRGGRRTLALSIDLLIADGASLVQLGHELDALLSGRELDPPPAVTFRDYVMSSAERPAEARSQGFWSRRAPGLPGPPELPLAMAPEQVEPNRFARETVVLPAERWRRLRERASERALTPSALLCAAYVETLALHARHPRFLLNVTTGHRRPTITDVDRVIGDFTSLTLLDADASAGPDFAARALALQRRMWEALEHRDVSGVAVLRERARHDPASVGAPVVFTSLLAATRAGRPPFSELGEPVEELSQTPQVWLDHQVAERDGALKLTFDHVRDLFPPGLVGELAARHLRLLTTLADAPESWSRARPVELSAAEQAPRVAANATTVPRRPGLLHEGVVDQVRARPESPAVITDSGSITFGELGARSTAVAEWLRALPVAGEQLVAIVMDKCPEQLIGALGILRAGAAYMPVDAALPPARIELLLEQGQAVAAVTAHEAAGRVPAGIPTLNIDGLEGTADDGGLGPARPDQLAYVIFTSGSTGSPKGVMIEHRAARNTVLDCNERFGLGPDDRALGISSMSFDLSVWDVFGVLGAGGAVVLPRATGLANPGEWARLCTQAAVSVWSSVPAIAGLLEEHLALRDEPLAPSLRLFMLSGDWIPTTLPARLRARAPGGRPDIVSLGGATEASIWSIWHPANQPVDPTWTSIPYGRPLANQTVHVLDEELRQRPDWVAGELFIGGAGLARGYWDDPAKTASAFIETDEGQRLYRTGDVARWRPGGIVEFLGREDDQVKVHGHRVELGEVESALEGHEQVGAAVARLLDRRLVAYLVAAPGSSLDVGTVRAHATEQLPRYMVPAALTPIPRIPLTANGKVDREALPDPWVVRPAPPNERHEAEQLDPPDGRPLDQLPEAFLELHWQSGSAEPLEALASLLRHRVRLQLTEALDIDAQVVDDDVELGALGIDSLAAIQLRGELELALGVTLPLAAFAGLSTVRSLSERLHAAVAKRAGPSPDAAAVAACLRVAPPDGPRALPAPTAPHEPFPLTDIQQAYWVGRDRSFSLGGVACHLYAEWEGPTIEVDRLRRALQRLTDRHPMLRARVLPDGRQHVPEEALDVQVRTGRGEEELRAWRAELDHHVGDPARSPLWEVRVVHLTPATSRLLLSFDLLVADGLSLVQIGRELDRLYADPAIELTEVPVTFRQCVTREPDPAAIATARSYWERRAPELPPGPQLPLADRPERIGAPRFRRWQARLDRRAWSQLRDRAAARSLSPSAVLCAAYAQVLAVHATEPHFTLAVTTSERPPLHPQIGEVVGDFTSVTPLEVHTDAHDSFQAHATSVQERLWQDLEHSVLSAVAIARERARILGAAPAAWPVVYTSLLGARAGGAAPLRSFGRLEYVVSQTPQVWLDHQVVELDGELVLAWDVVEQLFPPELIDEQFELYTSAVRRLAADDRAWRGLALEPAPNGRWRASASPAPPDRPPDAEPKGERASPVLVDRIAELVAEVLERPRVNPSRTLADLGADSLELVRLLNRIEAELGRRPDVDETILVLPLSTLAGRMGSPAPANQ